MGVAANAGWWPHVVSRTRLDRSVWFLAPGGDHQGVIARERRILEESPEGVAFFRGDQAAIDEAVSYLVDVGDLKAGGRGTTFVDGQLAGGAHLLEPGRGEPAGKGPRVGGVSSSAVKALHES